MEEVLQLRGGGLGALCALPPLLRCRRTVRCHRRTAGGAVRERVRRVTVLRYGVSVTVWVRLLAAVVSGAFVAVMFHPWVSRCGVCVGVTRF